MPPEPTMRVMTRPELDTLVDWTAAEGWNPGLNDVQIFWDTDPEGFIAAEHDGALIGGGSIVADAGRFGFMGFFIVRADHRSQGLGRQLRQTRRDRLIARLQAPAVIRPCQQGFKIGPLFADNAEALCRGLAEHTLLNGDDGSEDDLPELPGLQRRLGQRHDSTESLCDDGVRVDFWRLLRLFE